MMFSARIVNIGDVPLGGNYPVRIQSMTSTDTMDTRATVEQSIRMIKAGSEYVRITAPSVRAAENLANIKKELQRSGYDTPLIADIHYNPKAAEIAAQLVEKVRINPGNYVDKKSAGKVEFTEAEYRDEIEKIALRLHPLLRICKENGTAIRIGTNHGSLSDRILSKYGDTPEGMVESTLEFVRICKDFGFYDLVLSLKASNTRIMIDANRLLVKRMLEEDMDFPVHLGVTEAGDAEDGRIKSAVGIGTLLAEGIGNTVRVSLTEEPEFELPVAGKIVDFAAQIRSGEDTTKSRYYGIPVSENLKIPVVLSSKEDKKADLLVTGDKAKDQAGREYPIGEPDPETLPILKNHYEISNQEDFIIRASIDYAKPLLEGKCKGIWMETDERIPNEFVTGTSFDILQATGLRISKTEFIACPSCGRTLFNIQEALGRIKETTRHLKGLKIAVMGCIVNGPGEMADAHYGYVGSGKGVVTLYKGKEVRKRNIDEKHAVEELVKLIKDGGDWVD